MSKVKPLPDERLKEIALGLDAGQIFCNWHLEDQGDLSSVFMPLGLGAFDSFSEEDFNDVGMVYEHLEKQGPRSINGYPTFFSVRLVNKAGADKIRTYLQQLEKMKTNL